MGRALALFIWLMTLLSVWMFMSGRWWFPPAISEHGPAYDRQFLLTIIVVGVAFAAAQIGLGIAVWKFGSRSGDTSRAVYSHGNNRLEMIWTVVTGMIFISLGILGQQVWAGLHFNQAPAGASQVQVLAQQFQWNFHYAGRDGQFGRTDSAKIDDASLNFIGLDAEDPASKDDIIVSTLVTQADRPAHLILRSRDVTHSFWVPQLRFKQDAVPGLNIDVHFTPKTIGQYEIACAELCGQLHYRMKAYMLVLPADEYNELMGLEPAKFQTRLAELSKKYPLPKY